MIDPFQELREYTDLCLLLCHKDIAKDSGNQLTREIREDITTRFLVEWKKMRNFAVEIAKFNNEC